MILSCPACNASFHVPDGAIPATGRNLKCSKCQHIWFAMNEPENEKLAPSLNDMLASVSEDIKSHIGDLQSLAENDIKLKIDIAPIDEVSIEQAQATDNQPAIAAQHQDAIATDIKEQKVNLEIPHVAVTNKQANYKYPIIFSMIVLVLLLLTNAIISLYHYKWHAGLYDALCHNVGLYCAPKVKILKVASHLRTVKNDMQLDLSIHLSNSDNVMHKIDQIRFLFFDKNMHYIMQDVTVIDRILQPHENTTIEGVLNAVPSDAAYLHIAFGNTYDFYLSPPNVINKVYFEHAN